MTEVLDCINNIDLSLLTEYQKTIVAGYDKLRKIEGSVVFKKRITKKDVFLNIYCYDKTCWKYTLRHSFKIG